MIAFRHRGDFKNIERFFNKVTGAGYLNKLATFGVRGVEALKAGTPIDTGKTADKWTFEISGNAEKTTISWINTNVNQNVNIAIILQYGHGTGTGGYVQGRDYINPAMRPVFDQIAEDAWKEVTSA